MVTRIVSPLAIFSCACPTTPSIVTYCAVVGSKQLFFWKLLPFCSVFICKSTHHLLPSAQLIPGGKYWSSKNPAPAVAELLVSLLATQAPNGLEFGSQSAKPIQEAMNNSKFATLFPFCVGDGSVAGILNFHCMLLPEVPLTEKNSAVGSACPM